jgi:hypothetical protein
MRPVLDEDAAIMEGVTDLLTEKQIEPVQAEIETLHHFIVECCPWDEFCADCRDLFRIIHMLADEARDLERLDSLWMRLMRDNTIIGISFYI